jgi:hypothetical protein
LDEEEEEQIQLIKNQYQKTKAAIQELLNIGEAANAKQRMFSNL